jgi:hypothetical protein
MLLLAAFAYMIGWVCGELLCAVKMQSRSS